jgi:hypothetical protein
VLLGLRGRHSVCAVSVSTLHGCTHQPPRCRPGWRCVDMHNH